MLYSRTKALMVSDFVIGSHRSRHAQSSLVLSKQNDSENLAEILYFAECVVVPNCQSAKHIQLWVAAVNWFMEHPCKVWFGNPAQVWCTAKYPGEFFIPVTSIKSRVVYTQSLVNFGRISGSDTVYVVVPLVYNL